MSPAVTSNVDTLFMGSEALKRMEAFFEQGEMLTADRVSRNGGGVLLREMPPLIGQGPQVILVQPRDLVEGWRHSCTRTETPTLAENEVHLGGDGGSRNPPRLKAKSRSLQSISISPDFSKFLDRPETEERSRGGSRDPRSAPVVDDPDILTELTTRKPSWNFESILKEIEEDSVMVQSGSSSTTMEPCDSLPGPQDGFIEISLQGSDDADCKRPEDRQSSETQEALSRLFDQLLTDIYSHNLQPWCGQPGTPQRRRSDSILPHFNESYLDGHLNRQMSFPGALAERKSRVRLPVRCLSGIDRSSFTSMTTVGPLSYSEDFEETVLCENKLKLLPLSRIQDIRFELESNVSLTGKLLVVELEEKDTLMLEQHGLCEIVTASLQAISNKTRPASTLARCMKPPGRLMENRKVPL
ncbi:hypothetical protein GE061_007687 [Apolygus lucorum]|uniref:Uncharacterized protein n=1 Tax=Apolygus lucorum TaxID=248454 RepID=A0A8S9WNY6_APOLU|nr:hypothetical protein GE061_007687 [Apolygus lucorum]